MADVDRRESFKAWMRANDLTTAKVAKKSGVPATTLYDFLKGDTQGLRVETEHKVAKAYRVDVEVIFGGAKPEPHIGNTSDLPDNDPLQDYVEVEVLPTFAGMGGGGTGDGDMSRALVSRALVIQELRADPADLLIIDVRGDSMLDPATGKGFMHGDQLIVHRRDTNPRQPGPFALWYDDGYVVKNVEIIRRTGKLRIFSNNPAYSDDEADPEDVKIMGRPVWFARRL